MVTHGYGKTKFSRHFGPLLFFLLLLVMTHSSCNEGGGEREIDRSFYYWKSVLNISGYEQQKLDSLKVKTLYIKFFDVDWDEEKKQPKPIAKLQVDNYQLPDNLKIIPTVFITNNCIQKTESSQINILAANIKKLLTEITANNAIKKIVEIQFDCDWTASTREKYFALLNHFKTLKPTTKLSATIRLHQIKFVAKSGIPPVDRGLLMCYNMGNLKDPSTKNSVLENQELFKYIGGLSNYPLQLDVALPIFDWKVLYRNDAFEGLIQNLPASVFNNSFSTKTNNRWQILTDTLLGGYDLRRGDIIRDEQSDYNEILLAAEAVNIQLRNTNLRVSLYHLDSVLLSKYSIHELETIYNSMH